MIKIDPIIAVKDINASSEWYQSVFNCKRAHEGNDFAVLQDENDEVLICLHKWGEHEHPTMINPDIPNGNGLILYYKTDKLDSIRDNIGKIGHLIEKDIHLNPNSRKKEFSIRDIDGYYWTISEFHNYEG